MKMMKLYYRCNLFEQENFELKNCFEVFQNVLIWNSDKRLTNGKVSFNKKEIKYFCRWRKQEDWDSQRPTIIIPTKDNIRLIEKTIQNLKQNNLLSHCNVILVDDRSSEDIEGLCGEISYLRIDNDFGFNFSMLNNIAAKISHSLGNKEIILWNSDLWCVKEEWFLKVLKKHREEKSTLSGTKLVYPPEEISLSSDIGDTENINKHFPHMKDNKWRSTVQFGGSRWVRSVGHNVTQRFPVHYGRFCSREDRRVNCDSGVSFITGAFHIWDLSKFIEIGGLNPSLFKSFQDVDICLRLLEEDIVPMYFGKNAYFYHDESANFYFNGGKKEDNQAASDQLLFAKTWNERIIRVLL